MNETAGRAVPDDPLSNFRTTRSLSEIEESFSRHLDSSEPLEVLIRGHLWIESALTILVQRNLKRAGALDKARLSFSQLLAVADALGVVAEDEVEAIRQINRMRNRAAHRLKDLPTEQDQEQLAASCSARVRQLAGFDLQTFQYPAGFAQIIATMVVVLHHRIDELDAAARYSAHLHEQVNELRRRGGARSSRDLADPILGD